MIFFQRLFFLVCLFISCNGIAQFSTFKNYSVRNGLPSPIITNITQDNAGYIWLTTSKGISRFDGDEFLNFTDREGLITNKTTVVSSQANLLIGTDKGLSIKTPNAFVNFEEKKINCIVTTETGTFLGTDKGILRLRKDFLSSIRTNFQIDLNIINDIKFDGNFYWIATNKSLWKLDKLINPTVLKRIALGNYTAIILHKKNCIATTYSKGIKLINNDLIKTINTASSKITGIKKIDNQFWLITKNEGIVILDENFSFERSINKYNNTISTNQINTVFQDLQKNIWIASNNKGLFKLKGTTTTKEKPVINFQNIEIVYKTLDSININNYQKVLQLKPSKNHISFTYKTVNINNPKNVLYRYKLNNQFSNWTSKNTVDLAYLNPGNYTFIAQSKINKTISDPIEFKFFIATPIYQQKWFQQLIITLCIFLLCLIILFYIKKIKAKNRARIKKLKLKNHLLSLEQKALQLQMNPHFVFNILNSIKALGNTGKSDELNTTINKFALLLRSVLNNSRQDEISLAEEISALKNYIELEQQMSATDFNYELNTNLSLDSEEILIPPMLIQPFVENSIKHGIKTKTDGKITIDFSTKNNYLRCRITDNGVGFFQSKKNKKVTSHNSLAIKVTKERIKTLTPKNSFRIKELKDKELINGTRISFKIPLKTDF